MDYFWLTESPLTRLMPFNKEIRKYLSVKGLVNPNSLCKSPAVLIYCLT